MSSYSLFEFVLMPMQELLQPTAQHSQNLLFCSRFFTCKLNTADMFASLSSLLMVAAALPGTVLAEQSSAMNSAVATMDSMGASRKLKVTGCDSHPP